MSSIGPATTTLEVNLAQVPVQVRISPSTASKVAYITYAILWKIAVLFVLV